MADYFSQLVVRPFIPEAAMTELEHDILGKILEQQVVGTLVYFFASHGPNEIITLDVAEAVRMIAAAQGTASSVAEYVGEELGRLKGDETSFDLDLSMFGFESIFQDIVRRSDLEYVEVEIAWT